MQDRKLSLKTNIETSVLLQSTNIVIENLIDIVFHFTNTFHWYKYSQNVNYKVHLCGVKTSNT